MLNEFVAGRRQQWFLICCITFLLTACGAQNDEEINTNDDTHSSSQDAKSDSVTQSGQHNNVVVDSQNNAQHDPADPSSDSPSVVKLSEFNDEERVELCTDYIQKVQELSRVEYNYEIIHGECKSLAAADAIGYDNETGDPEDCKKYYSWCLEDNFPFLEDDFERELRNLNVEYCPGYLDNCDVDRQTLFSCLTERNNLSKEFFTHYYESTCEDLVTNESHEELMEARGYRPNPESCQLVKQHCNVLLINTW